jgi:Big-like domain-containing protein/galactose oxidase-like protein/Kelch motif protein
MSTFHSGLATKMRIRARLLLLAAIPLAFVLSGIANAQTPGTFSPTGSMSIPRFYETATQLLNGTVLITGGSDGTMSRGTAEIYDPSGGTFSATGSMTLARRAHTATLLQNGKVLIAGGLDNNNLVRGTAEIYDPATGQFTATGSMISARELHTATLLTNGTVLITGGVDNNQNTTVFTAELYDPSSGQFTATGNMHLARESHTATLLASGKVLIAGGMTSLTGSPTTAAEVYDPGSGSFSNTANQMPDGHAFHTAVLLRNGKVLVAGGFDTGITHPTSSAELYDPASNSFAATGNMTTAHSKHTAALLANGEVLIAAGEPSFTAADLYDPASGTFGATGSLSIPRENHAGSLLSNGQVLEAGGIDSSSVVTKTAELYTPPSMPAAKIMAPINAATVAGTVNVFTAVSAQVVWINVYVDGSYLASSPPYNFSWNSTKVANGTHTISIRAFNSSSSQVGSDSISVNVANGTSTGSGPVKITAPSNGATVSGTVTITTQMDSSAVWENIYIDGSYFASSPPSTFSWNSTTVANGAHTISAKAFNGSGQQIGTDSIAVNVANGTPTPSPTPTATPTPVPTPTPTPTPGAFVAVTSPSNGATIANTVNVDFEANGPISWFNIYIDGNYLESATGNGSIPTWDTTTVPNGSHKISITANNNSGVVASNYIIVTVANGSTPPPPGAIVAFYKPANGATVSGKTTVNVTAQGGISWINLYVDGQYFGSSPPYNFDWDTTTVANGSHTLSVRAYDTSGKQVGSNYITVNVSN